MTSPQNHGGTCFASARGWPSSACCSSRCPASLSTKCTASEEEITTSTLVSASRWVEDGNMRSLQTCEEAIKCEVWFHKDSRRFSSNLLCCVNQVFNFRATVFTNTVCFVKFVLFSKFMKYIHENMSKCRLSLVSSDWHVPAHIKVALA